MTEKPSTTLLGTVGDIVAPSNPSQTEQAQIVVQGTGELPQEIRIDNTLTTEDGNEVRLNQGATVKITIKA